MNSNGNKFHVSIKSDPSEIAAVRKRVELFAAEMGFAESVVGEIGLVVNEALANVIRHAYHNRENMPIEVSTAFADDTLKIDIRDWGDGVVPKIRAEKAANTLHTPGGLGIPCLKKMTDSLDFIKQSDGMLLKMTRQRR